MAIKTNKDYLVTATRALNLSEDDIDLIILKSGIDAVWRMQTFGIATWQFTNVSQLFLVVQCRMRQKADIPYHGTWMP